MRRLLLAALLASSAAPAAASPDNSPDALLQEHLWNQVKGLPEGERPKVGLVLSGGAVRGIAHIGVIKVLEEADFPVDMVAGTSMGAVIGSLYASGVGVSRLSEVPKNLKLSSGSNFNRIRLFQLLLTDSLLSTENLEKVLNKEIGEKRFDETPKPFACVAMDIRTGEKIIFREGPLAPAVRASMNMPGLFKPVLYRHRYLVDGGVVDYIPVDAAKLLGAEWTIASVTEGDFSKSLPNSVLLTLEQVIDIRGSLLSRQQRREANALIEPAVGEVAYYDVKRAGEVMSQGILAAKRALPPAKQNLILFTMPRLWRQWTASR